MEAYDFSGWATKNDLRCADGRVILKNAFQDNDGQTVPLVWSHRHDEPFNVLGHALLENRDEGVYAYCAFNDTEQGKNAKSLVEHGDVTSLSIYANNLKQLGSNVIHGAIKEVSLVLAPANPGAHIDNVLKHGEECLEDGVIYTGEDIVLAHSEEAAKEKTAEKSEEDNTGESEKKTENDKKETIQDVVNSMTEKQQNVLGYLVQKALEEDPKGESSKEEEKEPKEKKETSEGGDSMKHNIFDQETDKSEVLSHDEMSAILADAKRYGSLKESVLQHGIEQIDYLFPDAKNATQTPIFIQRKMDWVSKVMNSTHHTPFSRIKSILADITEDDARAKGYIKGNQKKEEVFGLLKRTTTPTTIYKKQKLDRDDVIDITDFDVVSWLKSEMRVMLDEEIARAILIGDGRLASSDDKINEQCIRPIATDADLYTIKGTVSVSASATDDDIAKAFIRASIKYRKDYRGSGEPVLFTTEDMLTDMLLLTDSMGRDLYDSTAKLANKMRVKEIVTVPVMEGQTGANGGKLLGVIVNLSDYNVGADKGGAVNMFDDFDIDYNSQKYLIETRCSGALTQPYSAIALELSQASSSSSPTTEEETESA